MLFTIDTPSATLPPSHNKAALVTIVIGNDYIATWNRLCRKGWEFYANVRGYDIILITQPLDTSERAASRSPAWQEIFLVLCIASSLALACWVRLFHYWRDRR